MDSRVVIIWDRKWGYEAVQVQDLELGMRASFLLDGLVDSADVAMMLGEWES